MPNYNTNFDVNVNFVEFENYDHNNNIDIGGYETSPEFESGDVYSEEELISSLL